MTEFKDSYIEDTVDNMDAILFTGDRLAGENEEIEKLLEILKKWEKQLNFLKEDNISPRESLLVSLWNRPDGLQITLHTSPYVAIIRIKDRTITDEFENLLYKSIKETKTVFKSINDYTNLKDKIKDIWKTKILSRQWREEFTFKY